MNKCIIPKLIRTVKLRGHCAMTSISLVSIRTNHDVSRAVELGATWATDANTSENRFFRLATLSDDHVIGFVDASKAIGDESTMILHSIQIDNAMDQAEMLIAVFELIVQEVSETFPRVDRLVAVVQSSLVGLYLSCGFRVARLASSKSGEGNSFEVVHDMNSSRRIPIVKLDAFTSEIFSGNPAAVVVMTQPQYARHGVAKWMQNIAKETNLSQTAFISRRLDLNDLKINECHFDLRWFSPTTEVPLCGHAALSSAFVLYNDNLVPTDSVIHFHTLSGELICNLEEKDGRKWITMGFPLREVIAASPSIPLQLIAASLNLTTDDFLAVRETTTAYILVHVPTERFADVAPDFNLLMEVEAYGIVVTAAKGPNSDGVDIQSRFFAPHAGVPEDPVTGSAHCALAGYWASVLNKTTLYAHQACPSRGGYLRLDLPQDRKDRVAIKGEAVVTLCGTLASRPWS